MGSDFPHAEGVAEPAELLTRLESFNDAEVMKMIHGNARRLLPASR